MATLRFILMAEIFISALLWMSGVQPQAVTIFSTLSGLIGSQTGLNSTMNTTDSSSAPIVPSPSSINTNTAIFGIIGIITGATVGTIIMSTLFGGSSFSVIYAIPAIIIGVLLTFFLSPITSLCLMVVGAQFPFSMVGWLMLVFFEGMTIIGVIDFIRGGEA